MADSFFVKLQKKQVILTQYSWRAWSRIISNQTIPDCHFFYHSNPHLNFAPREIQSFEIHKEGKGFKIDVSLNFMGLQGVSTPLPIHFSEAIIQDDPDDSRLNEFYNFFNQRIYHLLLGIEQKYAYLPQLSQSASDPHSKKLAAFAGFFTDNPTEKELLPFLTNLLGTNLEKGGWCRLISGFFGCEKAWMIERVPINLAIPAHSLGVLGSSTAVLGQTLSIGNYIRRAKNHFELHLMVECLEDFLPNQPHFQNLKTVVNKTLKENLFVTVVFHAKKARAMCLNYNRPIGLGWSSMLARNADSNSYSVKLRLL